MFKFRTKAAKEFRRMQAREGHGTFIAQMRSAFANHAKEVNIDTNKKRQG
jgi:hypothetical protein